MVAILNHLSASKSVSVDTTNNSTVVVTNTLARFNCAFSITFHQQFYKSQNFSIQYEPPGFANTLKCPELVVAKGDTLILIPLDRHGRRVGRNSKKKNDQKKKWSNTSKVSSSRVV